MLVTVTKTSNITYDLKITVPAAEVAAEELKRLQEIAPKVKIKGFRSGKVPFEVVRKQFAREVREEVFGKIIRESYTKAIQQEKLQAVSMPVIKILSDPSSTNVDLQFVATIEVLPQFSLPEFATVAVEKPIATLLDSDIDAEMEKLKKHYVKWEEVLDSDYAAKEGDRLIIDLNIKSLSDNLEKAEENVEFVLGSGMMWVEFEKPLYGAKAQGEFSYDLHFPVSHVDQSFAGKDVAVKVKVLKVSAAKMPTDEEVLKSTGFTDKGGMDGLRNHIKITMERELKYVLAEKYNANVITKLLELVPIEVPKGLIDMESQRRCDDMAAKLQKMSGFNKKPSHLKKEFFAGEATRTVTAGIILAKIIHDQKIAVTPEEVQAKLGEIAAETDSSRKDELVQSYNQNKTLLANVENLLIEEKALNFVKQQMQVVDKQISVMEALQR